MEQYVERKEFENLKEKVEKIEKQTENSSKLLTDIDKKVDGILIKLGDNEKIDDLTLKPLKERVAKLEDNQKWIWRTVAGTLITLIFSAIANLVKLIH